MAPTIQTKGVSLKEGSDTYILKTGEAGSQRLDMQQALLGNDSYQHLKKAGLSPGQTVWDIGCGNGVMTRHLAQIVGETGHVYALDISQEQIKVCQKRIQDAGFKNVTFIQGGITTIEDLPIGKADMVYARFVLMHLAHPEKALKNMLALLTTKGTLALQESILSMASFSLKSHEMDEYIQAIVALGKHKGVDFNIGSRLPHLVQDAGFHKVQSYCLHRKYTAQEAGPLMIARTDEWEDEALQSKLVTKEQLNQWKKIVKHLFTNPDPNFYCFLGQQVYVLAHKP